VELGHLRDGRRDYRRKNTWHPYDMWSPSRTGIKIRFYLARRHGIRMTCGAHPGLG
jgi:hypothetical protein